MNSYTFFQLCIQISYNLKKEKRKRKEKKMSMILVITGEDNVDEDCKEIGNPKALVP